MGSTEWSKELGSINYKVSQGLNELLYLKNNNNNKKQCLVQEKWYEISSYYYDLGIIG